MDRGRPTSYREEFNEQAYKLTLLGMIDRELAEFFGVADSTLNLWKTQYPAFSESIKRGKEIADGNVAKSLYKKAIGYEHDEDKIFCNSDGEVTTVKTKKRYPPDTMAASLFLRNRQPKKWRDKQEIDHTTKGESIKSISPHTFVGDDEN